MGVEVVAAGVDDHLAGGVGDDDARGELDGVGELGTAEAAVHDGQTGEIFGEGFPFHDAGTADEHDGVFRRRVRAVGRFEGRDVLFPTGGIVRGEGIRRRRGFTTRRDEGERQQQEEESGEIFPGGGGIHVVAG